MWCITITPFLCLKLFCFPGHAFLLVYTLGCSASLEVTSAEHHQSSGICHWNWQINCLSAIITKLGNIKETLLIWQAMISVTACIHKHLTIILTYDTPETSCNESPCQEWANWYHCTIYITTNHLYLWARNPFLEYVNVGNINEIIIKGKRGPWHSSIHSIYWIYRYTQYILSIYHSVNIENISEHNRRESAQYYVKWKIISGNSLSQGNWKTKSSHICSTKAYLFHKI